MMSSAVAYYSSSRLISASRSAAIVRHGTPSGISRARASSGTINGISARTVGTKGRASGGGTIRRGSVGGDTSKWSSGSGGGMRGAGADSTAAAAPTTLHAPDWGRPTSSSGSRGGKAKGGVRIFFENQAIAHQRRQQRLLQQRGKRTDNKKGTVDDEQPQLLKTFVRSRSGDVDGEKSGKGKEEEGSGGLSVPYRPFIFPGDAYRYPFYTSASRRSEGATAAVATPLPLLDSSPLLDPARYCKKSALPGGTTTVSGGDAARRLGRGRTRLGEIVRNQLVCLDCGGGPQKGPDDTGHGTARDKEGRGRRRRGQAFALDGTGVPRALMQGSLDLADELLRSMDAAAEISFGNCYDGSLDFGNVLRVRSRTGDNDPHPWPPLEENWMKSGEFQSKDYMEGCEHRMQLYLTVMNRLARTFGLLIDPTNNAADAKMLSTDLPEQDSDKAEVVDDEDSTPNRLDFDLRNWSVSFMRGLQFPPNVIADCQLGPLLGRSSGFESRAGYVSPPIVELNQSVGSIACPTHVRITIQGTPSASAAGSRIVSSSTTNRAVIRRRKRVSPLTLVFDAKFSRGDVSP